MEDTLTPTIENNLAKIEAWSTDVFLFAEAALNMKPSEPIDELRGKPISYVDGMGNRRTTILFDMEGHLVYHDLSFYTIDMFKHQEQTEFKRLYRGTRFTWQQTVKLEAYNRALATFGKDSYNVADRWISTRSGHGTGKTSSSTIIALHFLICFFGAQIGVTANSEDQLKDIYIKEFSKWANKLPEHLRSNMAESEEDSGLQLKDSVNILDTFVRIGQAKDWFLRARVARPEKPEALAGLHAEYVLIQVDEASAVHNKVLEVMKGALTGENYIVFYDSNPTRGEGDFFDSHKAGSEFTRLHFSSRESPIVKPGFVAKMEADYPNNGDEHSDEVKIRVDGEFAGVGEMDDKGWIPLFANMRILFEPQSHQVINRAVIGVDPAGQGRDTSVVAVRDHIYLKEVLNEKTSSEPDLARKIETIRDAYNCSTGDIGVEAFGIGAKVVANIRTKADELKSTPTAVLTDKPREETKERFHTYRSELAWRFREWVSKGGIIITNKKANWLNELDKIKYKRDALGRIMLMSKVDFKKEHNFSPDRFDASCMTFFKGEPDMPVHLSPAQLEQKETVEWLRRAQEVAKQPTDQDFSSM